MKIRHLQTRFIMAGILLVMTTVVSGIWSAGTFARLSAVADRTIRQSQQTIALIAVLSDSLEREDDALLLAMSGDRAEALQKLAAERQRFTASYDQLSQTLSGPGEQRAAKKLQQHAAEYRAAGDALLAISGQPGGTKLYYQRVNPALREAVADCAKIRESNFHSMQLVGIRARDEARGATILVITISAIALIISTLVAVALARSVLTPIQELADSVEAIRLGDFDRRVPVISDDELGHLAVGFNRMAEALADFRRSNLGEVMRAKETLESTIAALPDAVVVIDPDGRIVAVNPSARAVLAAADTGNANSLEDLPFPPANLGAIRDAIGGKRNLETRAELSRAFSVSLDGQQRKFMLTAVPIPEFWHDRHGAVAVLYDVTDFARLDELRMELVAVASHELKTPLTTLRMNLLLLGEKAENLTPRQQEILATAVLGCHELASTIDELLDLTRIESGQLRLARHVVDLYATIDHAIFSLRQRFEDAAITVRVAPECRHAFVLGDSTRLGMVFTNLLSNTLKYTPRGGSVSISVTAGHDGIGKGNRSLDIAVTDTGSGVPAEFRERVFDKFFRVEQHRRNGKTATWGAGIGLYLCRQIIEAHGGAISCQTGDNGTGTRIVMSLPSGAPPS
ncbi:MAG TPA: ATP-binding protein [Candidatus Binataceae bacterium]|nr:ATP-binding protein [Candidatus Binataceae bacterium]